MVVHAIVEKKANNSTETCRTDLWVVFSPQINFSYSITDNIRLLRKTKHLNSVKLRSVFYKLTNLQRMTSIEIGRFRNETSLNKAKTNIYTE